MSASIVCDQFSGVFGERRGGARANSGEMPRCPEGGHRELAALDHDRLRPESPNGWWSVGWYDSDLTFSFHLDDNRQALWQHHRRLHQSTDGKVSVERRRLSHDDGTPHLRLSWDELPEAVQERIGREVALGVHPLSGSTNDRPLNPF